MILHESQAQEQSQRVQVDLEQHPNGKLVKIRVEHHDEHLGWYTSGSLSLPIHQLPLLEQAVEAMRRLQTSDESLADKIIPFPAL